MLKHFSSSDRQSGFLTQNLSDENTNQSENTKGTKKTDVLTNSVDSDILATVEKSKIPDNSISIEKNDQKEETFFFDDLLTWTSKSSIPQESQTSDDSKQTDFSSNSTDFSQNLSSADFCKEPVIFEKQSDLSKASDLTENSTESFGLSELDSSEPLDLSEPAGFSDSFCLEKNENSEKISKYESGENEDSDWDSSFFDESDESENSRSESSFVAGLESFFQTELYEETENETADSENLSDSTTSKTSFSAFSGKKVPDKYSGPGNSKKLSDFGMSEHQGIFPKLSNKTPGENDRDFFQEQAIEELDRQKTLDSELRQNDADSLYELHDRYCQEDDRILDVSDVKEISPISILEAILFVGDRENRPLLSKTASEMMRNVSELEVVELLADLNERYYRQKAPYWIIRDEKGFRMVLRKEFEPIRERFQGRIRESKLSQAAIDVLSLVAYRQPIAADELQSIRGASCTGLLSQLIKRGLVQVIEQPAGKTKKKQYATTDRFLKQFNLRSLNDLPFVDDINIR